MTTTQREKIGVPFHPLTKEEIKQWYRDKLLTSAGYLLAIKKVTRPPGTSLLIPNVLKFCKEWEISKSAFYRAVNELREKGYTDWEATHGIILNESQKVISFSSEKKCPTYGTVSHERDTNSHERDTNSHERDTNSHERDTNSHEREKRTSKPAPSNDSSTPQIDQSYSEFIRSLSESERENFWEFGKKKAAQLPNPPALALKWIEAHFEELKEVWLKEREQSNCAHASSPSNTNNTSSTKVQNFELWESSSHEGQYHALMSLGLAKFCENRTSKSWYEWAKVKFPEKFIDIPEGSNAIL